MSSPKHRTSSAAQVRCGRVVDPDATYPHPCVLPEDHDGPCDPRPPEMRSAATPSLGAVAFYDEYAGHDPETIKRLVESGRRAYRCDCGDEICTGWQMLNSADVEFDRSRGISLYVKPDDEGYAPEIGGDDAAK